MQSSIEKWILDRDFSYIQPWFYENPYALRCELGMGDDDEAYMQNAERRAQEIFAILFPNGQPDAVIFDQYQSAESDCDACWEQECALFNRMIARRHTVVPHLRTDEDDDPGVEKTYTRNRAVCYRDGNNFDVSELIHHCIWAQQYAPVGLVSFANECIFSIYDDRGCDIVFATHEKLREFYPLLKPYFLSFDMDEMERRYEEG